MLLFFVTSLPLRGSTIVPLNTISPGVFLLEYLGVFLQPCLFRLKTFQTFIKSEGILNVYLIHLKYSLKDVVP